MILGANNLGKSVQCQRLTDRLISEGIAASLLKYPIYDTPTGQRIYYELRLNHTMTDEQLQREFAANRRCFEPKLRQMLTGGWVVSEDYKHTGIIWGLVNGVDRDTLEDMNKDLLEPDLVILLDGERFTGGIERGHRYEDGGKWEIARAAHLGFAIEYDWPIIDANLSIENVHAQVWDVVTQRLL